MCQNYMQKRNSPYNHELFMQRCLDLAAMGLGNVAPNPMVGSVIVREGKIIGEGYHHEYGQAHAEVNAINSVKDESLLETAILYVNLEPCAHSGKTPPCSDLIIRKKIPQVVIGTVDPNSLVAGKGIQKLKDSGIEVISNIAPEACKELNKRFFTYHEKKRPYIILKWAQTLDGFIDLERTPNNPIGVNWITGPNSRKLVHKWRSEEQAILAGTNTIIYDDPQLNVRNWYGKSPLRIVLDRKLRIPENAKVLDNSTPTLIYTNEVSKKQDSTEFIKLDYDNNDLRPVLSDLYERGVSSVLIEGGKQILASCIRDHLWDEARVFTGKKYFKAGLKAPVIPKSPESILSHFGDILQIFRA